MAEKIPVVCDICHKTQQVNPTPKGAPRTPNGWKLHQSQTYCGACWKSRYSLRAITIPVLSPGEGTWKEFQTALNACWQQSTAATSWAVRQLLARDVVRVPTMTKMPPMPPVYLYGLANEQGVMQEMPATSRQACFRAAEQKYRAKRYEIVWTGEASSPAFRYPQPFPIPSQNCSIEISENMQPTLTVRLGDKRWALRLGGGWRYDRAIAGLKKIVGGSAVMGEVAIFRQRILGNSHNARITENGSAGEKRQQYRVMVKVAVWLPKSGVSEGRSGTLYVKTTKEEFLLAVNVKKERLWFLHADLAQRWIGEHSAYLNHISDDRKAERRRPRYQRRRLNGHVTDRVTRHKRRIDTYLHTVARQLVQYADRNKFAVIQWDETEGSLMPSFPWFALRSMVTSKADDLGIECIDASAPVAQETP